MGKLVNLKDVFNSVVERKVEDEEGEHSKLKEIGLLVNLFLP